MTIKIRSTESTLHPIIKTLSTQIPITEIQGFIFQATDEQLFDSMNNSDNSIPIFCLEAVEIDDVSELKPEAIFSSVDWQKKLHAANFFNSDLLLLVHIKNEGSLFKLYSVEQKNSVISFSQKKIFHFESEFMSWWKSIKLLNQTKPTYEARSRQNLTIFDKIIERNGSGWGGNIDGIVLSPTDNSVKALVEIRQTRNFPLENYDPARFFLGTYRKKGDFKTWLPLVYLKNAYDIPLVLITVSTLDTSKFGFSEISKITKTNIFYENDITPNQNLNTDVNILKTKLLS